MDKNTKSTKNTKNTKPSVNLLKDLLDSADSHRVKQRQRTDGILNLINQRQKEQERKRITEALNEYAETTKKVVAQKTKDFFDSVLSDKKK